MRRALALAPLIAASACAATCRTQPSPVVTPAPTPGVAAQHYGTNSPQDTRAAHRLAIQKLMASSWGEAFDAVDNVQPRDQRRQLTEYLQLVAAVHLPDQALSADDFAIALSQIAVEPPLLDEHRRSADAHRAWIAAIQDVFADEAESRQLPRPIPQDIQNTHNLGALKAWESRGVGYDAATYNATKASFKAVAATLGGRLAMDDIFAGISAQNAHQVLFVDLTPFHFETQPPLALPVEADL